jgi:hypothetical protein
MIRSGRRDLARTPLIPFSRLFKRDIDFTIVERNLRLSTEQRAQQLVNATRFIEKFRPLVSRSSNQSRLLISKGLW